MRVLCSSLLILFLVSFSSARGDETEKIRAAEAAMMGAAAERGAEGFMSFYADDAVELPEGEQAIQGKANIAKAMQYLNDKNNRLTWTPNKVDVSGDLAYSYGVYEFRSTGKDGKLSSSSGKYTTIWKKQNDGSWKVVLDMGNVSPK
jgi:uncharacterized protein (TIGR02246 family)